MPLPLIPIFTSLLPIAIDSFFLAKDKKEAKKIEEEILLKEKKELDEKNYLKSLFAKGYLTIPDVFELTVIEWATLNTSLHALSNS